MKTHQKLLLGSIASQVIFIALRYFSLPVCRPVFLFMRYCFSCYYIDISLCVFVMVALCYSIIFIRPASTNTGQVNFATVLIFSLRSIAIVIGLILEAALILLLCIANDPTPIKMVG